MSIQNTAALFLKLAICKAFPHVKNCVVKADSQGFSCTFSYSETFGEAYLNLLEMGMKQWVQKEIHMMEMLASNAREFCIHHGHEELAETLACSSGTVFLAQIGEALEVCETFLPPCRIFSLFSIEQKRKQITLLGRAFENDREKKSFLKKWRQYPKKNHVYFARELELYDKEHWHPRGMRLRQILVDFWRQTLREEGIEERETADPARYFAETKRRIFGCWDGLKDTIYGFDEHSVTSLLQLFQKWTNIFKFKAQWVFIPSHRGDKLKKALKACGIEAQVEDEERDFPTIELRLADALGRSWSGPQLQLQKGVVRLSLFGDLKQFISLLLEQVEGELPFWLSPEQIKLLPLKDTSFEEVIEIFNRQKIRYSVDLEPLLLKEKIHRALRVKVPYVMVFGKQEEKSEQIKIRAYGSGLDSTMTMENLEIFLSERKLESQ